MAPRMRVLLIQPAQAGLVGMHRLMLLEPLALERLAAALPGAEVALLDMRLDPDLAGALQSLQPRLVGITCCFATQAATPLRLARQIKQWAPETTVVVGGHHPSLRPQDFADPHVDAIVCGEGELTLAETVQCLDEGGDLARVSGLIRNTHSGQQATPPRRLIANLDELPLPARHLTRRWRRQYYCMGQRPHALVETSRGCPCRCSFCSVWRFHGGGLRVMSPEAMVREIAAVQEPWVIFADDNFLGSVPRAQRAAELLAQRGIRKHYVIQTRSDTVVQHPELIAQWHKVGLAMVLLGLETTSDRDLVDLGKRNSVENNEAALRILRDLGIEFHTNFIADPRWDHGDFEELRRYVRQHKLFISSYSVLTPLPGTALFEEMEGQLTTRDWERYDLMHAVLPTTLPLEEFYAEYASLWRTTLDIVPWGWRTRMILRCLWAALKGEFDFGHMWALERELKALTDPQTYLRWHEPSPSSAIHSPAAGPVCGPDGP